MMEKEWEGVCAVHDILKSTLHSFLFNMYLWRLRYNFFDK